MLRIIKHCIRRFRLFIIHLRKRRKPFLRLSDHTVIIAPHPDDEVIGCAGLIQALVERGTPPHVIILTGGEGSHRGCCNTPQETIIAERHQLTIKAAKTLGLPLPNIHCLEFPDGGIAFAHAETEKLKALLHLLSPNALFVPHYGEGWSDHTSVLGIAKELMKCHVVNIYEYCVWMWYYNIWKLDNKNARILKMTPAQHQRKLQAIEEYTKPLAPCGKPWSGVLPKAFLKAARWKRELYFKVRV